MTQSVNTRRTLWTGTPIWTLERKPSSHHQALTRDLETDVLVVGCGISGALVAERIADLGLRVVLVDRRAPLEGSTAASTALLQYALDTPLTTLAREIGDAKAERVWRRSRAVVAALAERTARLGIEADLKPREGLYLSGELLDAKALQREARARTRIGLEVELIQRGQLKNDYGLRHAAALRSGGDYVADPRKLAAGYLRVASERGARLFSPVDIVSVHENRLGVKATTRQGQTLKARWVVFCTGYEVATGLRARGHSIQSTWVITTRPQRRRLWPTECMIWEASEPYLYLRTTSDGRVICGGADEEFSDATERDRLSPTKYRYLERRLHELLPELDSRADVAWAGTFGASKLGLPIIGRIPGTRRQLTVLGCGGNGITFSMLAAQILSSTILGDEDRDADLFTPHRE